MKKRICHYTAAYKTGFSTPEDKDSSVLCFRSAWCTGTTRKSKTSSCRLFVVVTLLSGKQVITVQLLLSTQTCKMFFLLWMLVFQLPSNLRQGNYYWEVGCDDCDFLLSSSFNDFVHPTKYFVSQPMTLTYDVTTILVQTDKAIYKPGQLGKYVCYLIVY